MIKILTALVIALPLSAPSAFAMPVNATHIVKVEGTLVNADRRYARTNIAILSQCVFSMATLGKLQVVEYYARTGKVLINTDDGTANKISNLACVESITPAL